MSSISLEKAWLYEQYRLPYAAELPGDLLRYTGKVEVVADIGAGTGQLARLFAKPSAKVYAIEPDSAMLAVGAAALAGEPAVEFIAGSAEQTGLALGSVDLIVVGNAFHRFSPEACEEFRRILRPRGWIAVIAYSFSDQNFADSLFSRLALLKRTADRIDRAVRRPPLQSVFGQASIHTLRYHQTHMVSWTAFFGSACAGIEAPERNDPDFGQFEALNREVFEMFAAGGRMQMVYETQVSLGQPAALD